MMKRLLFAPARSARTTIISANVNITTLPKSEARAQSLPHPGHHAAGMMAHFDVVP